MDEIYGQVTEEFTAVFRIDNAHGAPDICELLDRVKAAAMQAQADGFDNVSIMHHGGNGGEMRHIKVYAHRFRVRRSRAEGI